MGRLEEIVKSVLKERPGLWANIHAKRKRGEKPSHGNSQSYKDAVKAGKKINKSLKEILETTYPFKDVDQTYTEDDNTLLSVDYKFNTPTQQYKVSFYSGEYSPEDKTFDLSFGVDKGDMYKLDTFQMTGEGNSLKIFSTVIEIIKDFLYQYEDEGAKKIIISPTSEKRRKIYQMLLTRLPSNISSKVEIK